MFAEDRLNIAAEGHLGLSLRGEDRRRHRGAEENKSEDRDFHSGCPNWPCYTPEPATSGQRYFRRLRSGPP